MAKKNPSCNIALERGIVQSYDLGDDAILGYVLLKTFANTCMAEEVYFNYVMLERFFSIKNSITIPIRNIKTAVMAFINEFDLKCDMSSSYCMSFAKKDLDIGVNKPFVVVDLDDLKTLFLTRTKKTEKRRVYIPKLLKQYLSVITNFHYSTPFKELNNKIGAIPLSRIEKFTGYSRETTVYYNKLLAEMKLLYIFTPIKMALSLNSDYRLPNFYCKYSDKDLIVDKLDVGIDDKNLLRTVDNRKYVGIMRQRYSWLLNRERKFNVEQLKELKDFIVEYNKEIDAQIAYLKRVKGKVLSSTDKSLIMKLSHSRMNEKFVDRLLGNYMENEQIDGVFIDKNEMISENYDDLISEIDEENYENDDFDCEDVDSVLEEFDLVD